MTLPFRSSSFIALTSLAMLMNACSSSPSGSPKAETIVLLGDSITQIGEGPHGYVTLLRDTLSRKEPGMQIINAGISGNRVPDLLARLDRDVIARKPDVVVVFIGVNDVWHHTLLGKGTSREEYERGLSEIITRIRQAGAAVILSTPAVIGEKKDGDNQLDAMLDDYTGISRAVAQRMNVPLCDMRAAFLRYLQDHNPENKSQGVLTTDGVHLTDEGNRLVAEEMLGCLEAR